VTDYRASHIDKGCTYDEGLARDAWDSYMHSWEERHLRALVPALFPQEPPRYLDFACGTGRITSVVAPLAREAIGVDISPSMLEVARTKLPGVRFLQVDPTAEHLELGEFDLVTAFRFFGNAEHGLRREALRALNGLQATGGYLVVNNHRNPSSLTSLMSRFRGRPVAMDLTHARFKRLLASAGYEIVDVRPIGVWKYRGRLKAARRHEILEGLFRARFLAGIAPDAVIVARKFRDAE
jgi:SAM-dependent methyltransferase